MNNNDAIIQRIKGVPAQKGTLKDKFDPRNPNKPAANDSISVNEPHALRALLATMKSAKEKRVGMSIWDRDIKAVEDAIAVIEAIRAFQ